MLHRKCPPQVEFFRSKHLLHQISMDSGRPPDLEMAICNMPKHRRNFTRCTKRWRIFNFAKKNTHYVRSIKSYNKKNINTTMLFGGMPGNARKNVVLFSMFLHYILCMRKEQRQWRQQQQAEPQPLGPPPPPPPQIQQQQQPQQQQHHHCKRWILCSKTTRRFWEALIFVVLSHFWNIPIGK